MIEDDSGEQIKELMESANDALVWARARAEEFLVYANELEARANAFRRLAATMVTEAMNYTEEIGDLIVAEFPMEGTEESEPLSS